MALGDQLLHAKAYYRSLPTALANAHTNIFISLPQQEVMCLCLALQMENSTSLSNTKKLLGITFHK